MQIAIDGPAGAGKSTLAKSLAARLGFLYIDTGAIYRALTWKALQKGINLHDAEALCHLASSLDILFKKRDKTQYLFCDGEDVTEKIRSPQVSAEVSKVAAHPQVRDILVKKQQFMALNGDVVMDGRDIGEKVLPQAQYKFFVTAELEERVQRRIMELEKRGYNIDREAIRQDISNRDRMDSERTVGALKILPDSIIIDTTDQTAQQVFDQILALVGRE